MNWRNRIVGGIALGFGLAIATLMIIDGHWASHDTIKPLKAYLGGLIFIGLGVWYLICGAKAESWKVIEEPHNPEVPEKNRTAINSEIETLVSMLDDAEGLLLKHGISHWADWLRRDSQLIRNLDFYGIEHLLSAFGGMGSINDLRLIAPSKDNSNLLVTLPDDERFQSLLISIHALATKLSREAKRVY